MTNHALAELLKRALAEGGIFCPQTSQDHLPSQIDDGQLNGLCIRRLCIALEQHRHRHLGRRHWRLAGTRVAVHGSQHILKRRVEDLVAMESKKAEQFLHLLASLEQPLLQFGAFDGRIPTWDHGASNGRSGPKGQLITN